MRRKTIQWINTPVISEAIFRYEKGLLPNSMKWESSGELAQRDLSELVTRLLDVESSNNTDELTRLGSKYDEDS